MWKRFDPSLRRVVTAALREAARRGRDVAGPEHLLLALAEHGGDAGFRALVESVLDRRQPRAESPSRAQADRFDEPAVRALEAATRSAGRRLKVFPHHLAGPVVERLDGSIGADVASLGVARADARLGAVPPERGLHRHVARALADTAPGQWLGGAARMSRAVLSGYLRHGLAHPGYVTNPYPIYRRLREREPVRRDPTAPVWIVTSYEHALATLRDSRFEKDPFASERLPRGAREQLGMSHGAGARSSAENISMLFLDPPEHTRVRSVFTRAFTPCTLESLRPRVREICDERIAAMAGNGSADLIEELAYPLPVMVIADLLGFPRDDYQKLKKWSDDMAAALGFVPSAADKLRAARARDEMRSYFFERIVPRLRERPDGSLLSGLLELEARGEGLNEDELFSNSVLLLAAGHETTTNLVGNGVLALLRHPEQFAALRSDPSLVESAVEEMLRYDPPVQWTTRVAGQDMELGGKAIRRGELVLTAIGAANRDPKAFRDPEAFDVRRSENRHLSFGSGIHFCLGAALARMEAQAAVRALVERFPRMRLATTRVKWRKGITFRGVESLQLELR